MVTNEYQYRMALRKDRKLERRRLYWLRRAFFVSFNVGPYDVPIFPCAIVRGSNLRVRTVAKYWSGITTASLRLRQ